MLRRAGRRVAGKFPCALRFCVPLSEGRGKRGRGEVDWRVRGGLPVLPEEVEYRAIFPLGTGHADVGRQNPPPSDAAVGGPYRIYFPSNFHIPAGMWVRLLLLLRDADDNAFLVFNFSVIIAMGVMINKF